VEATQDREYRPTIDGATVYAFFVGDAEHLANGDVLVDAGGITPPVRGVSAQITEVNPSSSGEGGNVVFDLRVEGNALFVYGPTRKCSNHTGLIFGSTTNVCTSPDASAVASSPSPSPGT